MTRNNVHGYPVSRMNQGLGSTVRLTHLLKERNNNRELLKLAAPRSFVLGDKEQQQKYATTEWILRATNI